MTDRDFFCSELTLSQSRLATPRELGGDTLILFYLGDELPFPRESLVLLLALPASVMKMPCVGFHSLQSLGRLPAVIYLMAVAHEEKPHALSPPCQLSPA